MDTATVYIKVKKLRFHRQAFNRYDRGDNSSRQSIFEAFMNNEQTVNSASHGIKWGLIIGVVYAVFAILRHSVGASNPVYYSMLMFIGFAVVLVLLFICGSRLRRDNGGWIEMKEVFKAMFIAVLIFEAFFTITYFVYLKYINPGFFDTFMTTSETLLLQTRRPQSEIDQLMNTLEQSRDQIQNSSVFDLLKTYLYYVGITGLFAIIYAFILKRNPPIFDQDSNYKS
jgi:hypothetical protein